ncbi:hypothetical protein HY477_00770 [Candidatus Uhrbacteria bacterium]|nr:hypothetical protein [Candidatus Uhrbacteria bacterium]
MKYLIRAIFALSPLAALADPGHGAPVAHTHVREIMLWAILVGVAVWVVSRRLKSSKQ